MSIVTADESVQPFLSGLKGFTVIHDKSGKVIGRFYPGELTEDEMYAEAREQFDPEVIERRKAEAGGRTTAEVLERLRALEK